MVNSFQMMSLMDRNSSMNNVRLDNLLLDDGLNMLVDVVVHSLTGDDGSGLLSSGSVMSDRGIPVSSGVLLKSSLDVPLATMVELLVLHGSHVVMVLLGKDLLVCDGLHSCVVMMLVDLLVYSGLDLFMVDRLDMLLCDGTPNVLVDGGLVLAIVREERGNGVLSFLHCV